MVQAAHAGAPRLGIRAEGVPPVPASLAEELNRYQNIRSASFQDWDDTKERAIYITTRFADTPQVHYLASPVEVRRQLTFFDDRVLRRLGPAQTRAVPLREGRGRGARTISSSCGIARRSTAADHRRQEPQHRARLVPFGRPSGLEQQRPRRPEHGHLPRRSRRPSLSAPLERSNGQWAVADWSPDGIQDRRRGIHLHQ